MATRATVQGRFTPEKGMHVASHSAGFDTALDDALGQLHNKWGNGKFKNVKVQYAADITVTNPGTIDTYIVNLVP